MYPAVVVNLFGGPGTGKSTNAALLFGKLKSLGINAEYISEFAKDLTWEQRSRALSYQPYVTAKQMFKQFRVAREVEVIITDSPILLGIVYQGEGCTPSFNDFIVETYHLYDNLTYFLERNSEHHPYNPKGRNQSEFEASLKDWEIQQMLDAYRIPYEVVPIQAGERTAEELVRRVITHLEERS